MSCFYLADMSSPMGAILVYSFCTSSKEHTFRQIGWLLSAIMKLFRKLSWWKAFSSNFQADRVVALYMNLIVLSSSEFFYFLLPSPRGPRVNSHKIRKFFSLSYSLWEWSKNDIMSGNKEENRFLTSNLNSNFCQSIGRLRKENTFTDRMMMDEKKLVWWNVGHWWLFCFSDVHL